jgi:hypothetical protein
MSIGAITGAAKISAALAYLALLSATGVHAEGIDTEHLFAFMIGTDTGSVGEREFKSQTTGRLGREGGHYRAGDQEFELEFVPFRNLRIELGSSFAAHDINGVPGLEDRRQLAWQGVSVDLHYRLLDRENAPFGLTVAFGRQADKLDERSGAAAWHVGTDFALAFDREIVPDTTIAALNLIYQPEWTRFAATDPAAQESTIGAALALMTRVRPNIFLGAEARYLRRYEGIGLDEFAGQALFVGPTAYFQLSDRSRLTAAWSVQAWGHAGGSSAALDLTNFERHQARLVFGVNF